MSKIRDLVENERTLPSVPRTSETGQARIPSGTTLERDTPETGDLRFNTDETKLEYYEGSEWKRPGEMDSVVGATDEIEVDNTDPKNPVISISENFPGQQLKVPPGTEVTGNILGGTLSLDSTLSTIQPFSCMDDTNTVNLYSDTVLESWYNPLGAVGVRHWFVVQLDDGTMALEVDTNEDGSGLPANVVYKRWMGFGYLQLNGEYAAHWQKGDVMTFPEGIVVRDIGDISNNTKVSVNTPGGGFIPYRYYSYDVAFGLYNSNTTGYLATSNIASEGVLIENRTPDEVPFECTGFATIARDTSWIWYNSTNNGGCSLKVMSVRMRR